jgi:hypothetical protein
MVYLLAFGLALLLVIAGLGQFRRQIAAAYFHRFRPVVFTETDPPCSRKPAMRFHDFGHPFSTRTAHVEGELSV